MRPVVPWSLVCTQCSAKCLQWKLEMQLPVERQKVVLWTLDCGGGGAPQGWLVTVSYKWYLVTSYC